MKSFASRLQWLTHHPYKVAFIIAPVWAAPTLVYQDRAPWLILFPALAAILVCAADEFFVRSEYGAAAATDSVKTKKPRSKFPSRIFSSLNSHTFTELFGPLEMLFPDRVRKEVWQPAFFDEVARSAETRGRSNLRVVNFIFALKMILLVINTFRITLLDWLPTRLSNRRARLAERSKRR